MRRFLPSIALLAVCASVEAAFAKASEPIVLRVQSSWPASIPALQPFNASLARWAGNVDRMSEGALRIEVLSCCPVAAPALHRAVSDGRLDGAHVVPSYLYSVRRAAGLFGGASTYGLGGEGYLEWMRHGGGEELYRELLDALGLDVVSIFYGPMEPQPLGWFPHEITHPADLVGLRYRTIGLAGELAAELGLRPVALAAGAIVPALAAGTIDAAEFNTPAVDLRLGFHALSPPRHYMLGGIQQDGEAFEIVLNRAVHDALAPELRDALRAAARFESREFRRQMAVENQAALAELAAQGVPIQATPPAVVEAQRCAWERVVARGDDLFRRTAASLEAFARKKKRYVTPDCD